MSVGFPFSRFFSCYFCLLLVMALFHLCFSSTNSNPMLCMDDERQALLQFKHGLIDGADQLASWVRDENSDCCKWTGIVCDNITGHVHKINLPSNCRTYDYNPKKTYEECSKQKLRGDLSSFLLNLKQLTHLDLSNNDFGGKQIPRFMGSLSNLRYLNLSRSGFGGTIPPQLGNLSELRILSLSESYESISVMNMQWLSGSLFLHHLDMSGVDLSRAFDWLQVINTLRSLTELHLSGSKLIHIHPHVASLNLTSLYLLDLSRNDFSESLVPRWIFSTTSLVSLDLSECGFRGLIPSSSEGFHNMTSLELVHVSWNDFMNSSYVLKGLSSSNLISLDISECGVSSLVLDSLHNLTSILSLDLSDNQLTKAIPKSLGDLCNLRDVDLSYNSFGNISLKYLLESFFECKSPSLESITIDHSIYVTCESNCIVGIIPDSIGRLSFLKYLNLKGNLISGQIPYSIGGLSSLEVLTVSNNRLNGSLPESLGLLSNLEELDISHNLLTGVVTDAHFANLNRLKYLDGSHNNLVLRPRLANWRPHFRLASLSLSYWDIGPQFPLWLLQQSDLYNLEMSNTRISSTMPDPFWGLFPSLEYLDMSQNNIQGRLLDIPRTLSLIHLSYNQFSGQLPKLSYSSSAYVIDLSYNSFVGSLHHLICSNGGEGLSVLNLANNHLSGVIPKQCWENYPRLTFLNLDNNNLSGEIPRTLGSLSSLYSLNMCNNKLSGRLPTSLKNLTNLEILQLAGNNFVGRIPQWLGTEFSALRILNLRRNKFQRNITHELCYLTSIQILDLAHNNLSGSIPRCFTNFTFLFGHEVSGGGFSSFGYNDKEDIDSALLMIKGREDIYSTILELVKILDLSSNNFYGDIPSELMALRALQSLNLSGNQLTGSIPKNIGDMKSLLSFDVSLNQLYGELPQSLSSLSFLSSFNVSYNNFTGRVPISTQLQSFDESSFIGNKLCGKPLTESCAVAVQDADHEEEKEIDGSDGADWVLIISTVLGFIAGFWIVVIPLLVNTRWRIAYFSYLRELRRMVYDVIRKCWCNRFHK